MNLDFDISHVYLVHLRTVLANIYPMYLLLQFQRHFFQATWSKIKIDFSKTFFTENIPADTFCSR